MNNQRLIDLFLEVARINALSGNEKPLAEYIKSFLTKFGYHVNEDNSRSATNSNTGNLICKIGNGGNFLLLSHMDLSLIHISEPTRPY